MGESGLQIPREPVRYSALRGQPAHSVRLHRDPGMRERARSKAIRQALSQPFELRPGDRWHRMLAALEAGGPMTEGDLFRASRVVGRKSKIERARVNRAISVLKALGLIAPVETWGWALTAEGRASLAALTLPETSQ